MAIGVSEIVAASAVLDPPGKALVNLWLQRDLDDEVIAGLIGSTSARVAARREQVLDALARELDTTPEGVRDAIHALASASGAPRPAHREATPAGETSEDEPEDDDTSERPPEPAPTRRRRSPTLPATRRRLIWSLAAVALLAAIATVVAIAASSDSKDSKPARAAPKPPKHKVPHPARRPKTVVLARAPLRPLGGAPRNARGIVAIERGGGRLFVRLRLTGLPSVRGAYRLWLYNSPRDALALGDANAAGALFAPFPKTRRTFHYVDVSAQPPASRGHSGPSVLRSPRLGR